MEKFMNNKAKSLGAISLTFALAMGGCAHKMEPQLEQFTDASAGIKAEDPAQNPQLQMAMSCPNSALDPFINALVLKLDHLMNQMFLNDDPEKLEKLSLLSLAATGILDQSSADVLAYRNTVRMLEGKKIDVKDARDYFCGRVEEHSNTVLNAAKKLGILKPEENTPQP
jgi:hypothetical protein